MAQHPNEQLPSLRKLVTLLGVDASHELIRTVLLELGLKLKSRTKDRAGAHYEHKEGIQKLECVPVQRLPSKVFSTRKTREFTLYETNEGWLMMVPESNEIWRLSGLHGTPLVSTLGLAKDKASLELWITTGDNEFSGLAPQPLLARALIRQAENDELRLRRPAMYEIKGAIEIVLNSLMQAQQGLPLIGGLRQAFEIDQRGLWTFISLQDYVSRLIESLSQLKVESEYRAIIDAAVTGLRVIAERIAALQESYRSVVAERSESIRRAA